MNALSRQTMLAEYMLSAEPQVRDTLYENDFLYSDRYGIITFDPLVFRPPGDIQNKLLSENRKAMAAIEDNGVFSIWTGEFDKNGMPTKEKKLVYTSLQALNNGDQIGPDKRPYLFGFKSNTLGIYSLPQGNKNVGTLATTPSYTLGSSVKVKLLDSGALNIYISDVLFWTSEVRLAPNPPTTPPGPGIGGPVIGMTKEEYDKLFNQNTGIVGPGTSNPLTPKTESLFSNPLVLVGLAGAAFFAFKSFNK